MKRTIAKAVAGGLWVVACSAAAAGPALAEPGLLFRASGDQGFEADVAGGDPIPNFQEKMSIVPDGRTAGAMRQADDGSVAWNAPGNLYAQRGSVAFFWRPHTALTKAPFVIFRTSFAAHTSFDMSFLRIEWNGQGLDAFVTDANLSRLKISYRMAVAPKADAWTHLALGWDEAQGLRLFVDGREVSRVDQKADLDAGLDQFGFAGRMISPHQVHSRYNFMRGSDADELRTYDRMLTEAQVAQLAAGREPALTTGAGMSAEAWRHRYGWDSGAPPALEAPSTRIRKVQFADAKDLKALMWKGVDGIPETTWPGVYNRSRLPGRDDRIVLPDWNVYVDGGKAYDLTLPEGETFNRVEIRGAAFGVLKYAAPGADFSEVEQRPAGLVRSVLNLDRRTGGRLRFENTVQETPIQEIWAYDIGPGEAPKGSAELSYVVRSTDEVANDALIPLQTYIAARHPVEERATVVALPQGAPRRARAASDAPAGAAPMVHVLIPSRFDASVAARPVTRSWNYGWQNMHSGLDGIELKIPALNLAPGADGLIALNVTVKDPIWPGRDMIDVSFSVRPDQERTVWLDLRDRILTDDSLWMTIASDAADFGQTSIDGMGVRLVFKDREIAKVEHLADRFAQVRDNWSFLVEARPATVRAGLYRRLYTDISDLLRIDPYHEQGRIYWQDIAYATQDWPAFKQSEPTNGTPLWAFRQLEDLKLVSQFVQWWIDERQVPYGDFGGGISDDTDMVAQWPGLALMGVQPDKIRTSLNALADAVNHNGMITNGLGTISTDELHAYEEGLNSDAASLYLNWGDPLRVERLMATTKALETIATRNSAGHRHFSTNWYGSKEAFREGGWEWQKLYSFTVMHAPILLGGYNGSPRARALVTETVDGLLAHGSQKDGVWSYPNEINWRTDAERVGDTGGAPSSRLQSAWASWRWTGDERYLRPIVGRVAEAGPESLAELNENLIDVLDRRADWGAALTRTAGQGSEFARYNAWLTTGDKTWLEQLHGSAIQTKSQRMYLQTDGHWWTDRVEQPSEILQRERLGGVALKRNWTYPGHAVSWRFADPAGAEAVALLVKAGRPDRFEVIAYNTADQARAAQMTAWGVTSGLWQMRVGTDRDGDDKIDGDATVSQVRLERSASIDLTFAPRSGTVIEFVLLKASDPVEARADLGVGTQDVTVAGGRVTVTVHSLGAVAASSGLVTLEDADGRILATAAVGSLAAPLDLAPKTVKATLVPSRGAVLKGARVRVALAGGAPEVTLLNNIVTLP